MSKIKSKIQKEDGDTFQNESKKHKRIKWEATNLESWDKDGRPSYGTAQAAKIQNLWKREKAARAEEEAIRKKEELSGYNRRRRNKPLHVKTYVSKRKLCENVKENKKHVF
jgi:hypothetical protein